MIQPGSRVTYKLLVAGDSDALAEWSAEVAANLPDGIRLFGVRGGAEQIGRALERAERSCYSVACSLWSWRGLPLRFQRIALLIAT